MKKWTTGLIVVITFISLGYFGLLNERQLPLQEKPMSKLAEILNAYGYAADQQEDIVHLLVLSGCLKPEQFEHDATNLGWDEATIASTKTVLPRSNSGNPLDFKAVLDHFGETASLEAVHHWFIKVTQRDFFARAPGQERWQQETGEWMKNHEEVIRTLIDRLQLVQEMKPVKQSYHMLAVFGATYPEMVKRLQFAKNIVDEQGVEISHVYLLGGERPAKEVDGGAEFLQDMADKEGIALKDLMESHLFNQAYLSTKGEGVFAGIPHTLVNAPRGDKERPNTLDTLHTLQSHMDPDEIELLFVSRAPYIRAQYEDVRTVYNPYYNVEVVGSKADPEISLSRVLGSLGGSWYGGYVRVAKSLGSEKTPAELKDTLKTLGFGYRAPQAPSPQTEVPAQAGRDDRVLMLSDALRNSHQNGQEGSARFGIQGCRR